MAAGYLSKQVLTGPVSVGNSQTLAQAATFRINDAMRTNLVVDVLVGQASGTPTLSLQDTTGLGVWNTATTASASASTQKTISSVAPTTGTLTSAAHGYTNGQLVTLNSTGDTPGGLRAGSIYLVCNATASTFQLSQTSALIPIAPFETAGAGTLTTSAIQVVTLRMNVEDSGDRGKMPLRPTGRIAVTTTGGESAQLVGVLVATLS